MTKIKSNQNHGIKIKRWIKFVSTLNYFSDGEIIIYSKKKPKLNFIESKSQQKYLIDTIIKKVGMLI
jgi:hypothetical protein